MRLMTNYLKVGRDPGWIELFFDLAFVIILSRMAHKLFHTHHGRFDKDSLVVYIWIFLIMFLIWILFTVYMNIYGNDEFWQTLCGFALMTGLMGVALLMENAFGNARWIAVIVSFMCLLMALMYRKTKGTVVANMAYATFKERSLYVLASLSFIISFTPYVVIGTIVVYIIERIVDENVLRHIGMTKPDSEHLVERIGIFMIILIGESFITIVDNIPNALDIQSVLLVVMMIILLFSIFINYYTIISEMAELSHNNYSEVMFTNMLVMSSLTVLPALIYHGIHQELMIHQYKWLAYYFIINFVFGNAVTYNKSPDRNPIANIFYPMILPILLCVFIYFLQGYWMTIAGLMLIFLLTGGMVLRYKKQLMKEATSEPTT